MAERYKIYEQLGAGGVGAVYRAYDNELKRWVAIKRLMTNSEIGGDQKLALDLRREADALAAMRNPNVVTIFDVASDAEGLFIVMELLEGEDLADVVARGPLHYDDFKELASQTMEALLGAHQRHILHRDIKPENIKVERLPGGRMQSKIIDFGLARTGMRARKQTEDQSGTIMGSIFYMAPEQLTRQPMDERTDLYAIGCVYYEALSGRKAFDGDTISTVIDKHINHDLVPLHIVAPHVPPWLGAWVLRLMAQKPDERPANAQQAIEEFRAWEKMAAAPQMMPWMPPVFYQTGQEPSVYYQTGQLPPVEVVSQQEPVVKEPVAAPQLNALSSLQTAAPKKVQPAPRPYRATPAQHSTSRIDPQIRKYALIGIGALVIVVIGSTFMGGDKKGAGSDVATATSVLGSKGPEKPIFELPNDRPFPPQDDDLVLHLISNVGQAKNSKDAAGRPSTSNINDPIYEWHDLSPRGQSNIMRAFQNTAAYAPLRQNWNHPNVKSGRSVFDFHPRGGKPSALLLTDPGSESAQFPFGSAGVKGPKGLTFSIVFQADATMLPTRVMTLLSANGSSVSLSVNKDKHLVAEFRNDAGATSTINSKDVDGAKPMIAILIWDADTGTTSLRARDGSDKGFKADGAKVTAPSQPLTRLQLGRVSDAAGTTVGISDQFTGMLAEVEMYASALRTDQLQLLEGANLKNFYFNFIPQLAQRLKTKLPQIEPRSAWKFQPSQNAGEATKVADGNVTSRWTTKTRQTPGQWFQVELPEDQEVAGLALDCQAATGDYPRKYLVEVSSDGSNWSKVNEGDGKGALIEIIFSTPQRARFVRITQKSTTPTNDWGICEMVLFKK
jgi:serine/threonine protein kinase